MHACANAFWSLHYPQKQKQKNEKGDRTGFDPTSFRFEGHAIPVTPQDLADTKIRTLLISYCTKVLRACMPRGCKPEARAPCTCVACVGFTKSINCESCTHSGLVPEHDAPPFSQKARVWRGWGVWGVVATCHLMSRLRDRVSLDFPSTTLHLPPPHPTFLGPPSKLYSKIRC